MTQYTIISEYSPFNRGAYEKFPFGRDWNILGPYDNCYAAICQYLMKRYETIEQSYEPMCLVWAVTRDVFFEHGDKQCEVDGETIKIIKT